MVISGVIRPPPDIRAVADKTSLFVAKNGRAFEDRILKSEKGKTPKFAFLHSNSPFHAYYEERIRFYQEGGKDGEEKDDKEPAEEKKEQEKSVEEPTEERKQDKAQKASAIDPVARALLTQRKKIKDAQVSKDDAEDEEDKKQEALPLLPPPKLNFISVVAPTVPPAQLETIKLVAQFTALDGKTGSFLKELAVREWSNPAFAFVQPRHGHFAYFSALVDGYRLILSTGTKSNPSADLPTSVDSCLEVAAYRAEYERDALEREQQAQEEGGNLGGASQIDWHDFVVVETIDFPVDEVVQMSLPPPPRVAAAADGDGMEESDEEEGEAIRVVPSYQAKVVSTKSIAQDASRTHMIDPITGKSVAVADMPEHMRIQLLDPKWAEEKKKFMDKQKETNLVSGDMIASNISRFAQARSDMLGSQELSNQDATSKQRLDEANRVIQGQAQIPRAGPVLPAPVSHGLPPPPVPGSLGGDLPPPAKRARVDDAVPLPPPPEGLLPPPPPPAAPDSMELADATPEEPIAKEPMSEADFAASLDSPTVQLTVRIPKDSTNTKWNFDGQLIPLSVDVMSKVKAVKEELKSHLGGMPVNKMQLKAVEIGFLKDALTLAHLNIGPSGELEMVPKTRGGRK